MQEGTEGLPISVQVASLMWEDEVCLRVMKIIENAKDSNIWELEYLVRGIKKYRLATIGCRMSELQTEQI